MSSNLGPRALFRDLVFLGVVAMAAVVIGLASSFLFAAGPAPPNKPKTFTHIHCSECLEEFAYNKKLVGKPCGNCDRGGTYVATIGSLEDLAKEPSVVGRAVVVVLTLAIALQGVVFVGIKRLAVLRERAEEARLRTLVARCPFCQRRIAYPIANAGTWTTCYQCKTAFALPGEGPAGGGA